MRRNFQVTFIGNSAFSASQWLLVVLIARLGSVERVGEYSLGLAITAPLMLLAGLQLRGVQATDAKESFSFREYLRLRLVTTVAALGAIAVIAALSRGDAETRMAIGLVGLTKAIESISDIYYGHFQQHEQMGQISSSLLLRGAAGLLAVAAGFYLMNSLNAALLLMAAAWAIVLVLHDIPLARRLVGDVGPKRLATIEKARLLQLARLAAPLGAVTALVSLNANIPRYFLAAAGKFELGVFAAVGYLLIAGLVVVNALAQSANARLARYYAANDKRRFRELSMKLMLIAVALGLAAILGAYLFGAGVLAAVYGAEFRRFGNLLVLFAVVGAVSFQSAFLGVITTAMRRFFVQVPIQAASVAIVGSSAAILVPKYHLWGAAVATLLGNAVSAVGFALVVYRGMSSLQDERTTSPVGTCSARGRRA